MLLRPRRRAVAAADLSNRFLPLAPRPPAVRCRGLDQPRFSAARSRSPQRTQANAA
ncbi:hypothetical protein GLE_3351 [Lysobacter enzymogenes]|uniref:Uncharacterized protein n=1 Tax=Lysobacter enzymogenes TaxID=69 RepID=A0A0S2DJT7_LYSEN|nr:hypothetical protein GLE_3351 [Lysobacter enzymogenes]